MQLSADLTDGTSTSCTRPQAGEDGKPCLLSIFHVPGLSRTPSVNPYNDPAIFISLTLQIKAAHRNAPRAACLARSRRGLRTRACPTPTSSSANPDVTAGLKRVDGWFRAWRGDLDEYRCQQPSVPRTSVRSATLARDCPSLVTAGKPDSEDSGFWASGLTRIGPGVPDERRTRGHRSRAEKPLRHFAGGRAVSEDTSPSCRLPSGHPTCRVYTILMA